MYFMSDPFAFRKERFVGGIGMIRRAGKSEGNQFKLTKWENATARETKTGEGRRLVQGVRRLLAEADETNECRTEVGLVVGGQTL
jgi:hypothetical protein